MRRRWQRVPVAAFARRQPARISRAAADTSAAGTGSIGVAAIICQLSASAAPDRACQRIGRGRVGGLSSGAGASGPSSAALRCELLVRALQSVHLVLQLVDVVSLGSVSGGAASGGLREPHRLIGGSGRCCDGCGKVKCAIKRPAGVAGRWGVAGGGVVDAGRLGNSGERWSQVVSGELGGGAQRDGSLPRRIELEDGSGGVGLGRGAGGTCSGVDGGNGGRGVKGRDEGAFGSWRRERAAITA